MKTYISRNFDTEVAKELDTDCAILLDNILFWVYKNKTNKRNFHNGKYWTYNSLEAFTEQFYYLSTDQIRRRLDRLEETGYIETAFLSKNKYDRTKSYTIGDMYASRMGLTKEENPFGNSAKSTITYITSDITSSPAETEKNEEELYGKSIIEEALPQLDEDLLRKNEWLNQQQELQQAKQLARKKKELRKKYPGKSKVQIDRMVEDFVPEVPKPVYTQVSQEFSDFIDWWVEEINKGIPLLKDSALMPYWSALRQSYSVAHLKCAVRIARHHPFWKTRNNPHNLFRPLNSNGQPMDVINQLLNYKGEKLEGDLLDTYLNKKRDYYEMMKEDI
jgi:hypothetical protein